MIKSIDKTLVISAAAGIAIGGMAVFVHNLLINRKSEKEPADTQTGYLNNPSAWVKMKTDIRDAMTAVPPPPGPSDWAKAAWEWGIANGITDGTRPRDNALREETVSMIYRARLNRYRKTAAAEGD